MIISAISCPEVRKCGIERALSRRIGTKLSVASILLCLLLFCGCDESENCQLGDAIYFRLHSLDMKFDVHGAHPEFDAILVEMPCTGTSGHFVLRDEQGNDYRFEPWYDMDWKNQLDVLELG